LTAFLGAGQRKLRAREDPSRAARNNETDVDTKIQPNLVAEPK
jgi:hypothetical protein